MKLLSLRLVIDSVLLVLLGLATKANAASPWMPSLTDGEGFLLVTGWLAAIAYFVISFIAKLLEIRGRVREITPTEHDMMRVAAFVVRRIKVVGKDGDAEHEIKLKDWSDFPGDD